MSLSPENVKARNELMKALNNKKIHFTDYGNLITFYGHVPNVNPDLTSKMFYCTDTPNIVSFCHDQNVINFWVRPNWNYKMIG